MDGPNQGPQKVPELPEEPGRQELERDPREKEREGANLKNGELEPAEIQEIRAKYEAMPLPALMAAYAANSPEMARLATEAEFIGLYVESKMDDLGATEKVELVGNHRVTASYGTKYSYDQAVLDKLLDLGDGYFTQAELEEADAYRPQILNPEPITPEPIERQWMIGKVKTFGKRGTVVTDIIEEATEPVRGKFKMKLEDVDGE
jgi:hypothetical protein